MAMHEWELFKGGGAMQGMGMRAGLSRWRSRRVVERKWGVCRQGISSLIVHAPLQGYFSGWDLFREILPINVRGAHTPQPPGSFLAAGALRN